MVGIEYEQKKKDRISDPLFFFLCLFFIFILISNGTRGNNTDNGEVVIKNSTDTLTKIDICYQNALAKTKIGDIESKVVGNIFGKTFNLHGFPKDTQLATSGHAYGLSGNTNRYGDNDFLIQINAKKVHMVVQRLQGMMINGLDETGHGLGLAIGYNLQLKNLGVSNCVNHLVQNHEINLDGGIVPLGVIIDTWNHAALAESMGGTLSGLGAAFNLQL
jgi:hypothetical protein